MYKHGEQYVFSASDLITYMKSDFASWMDRYALDYPDRVANVEKDNDPMLSLLAEKGNKHEEHFLGLMADEYGDENVVTIDVPRQHAFDATLEAMQQGAKIIFQAYLKRDTFAGYADFLVRREGMSSHFGDYYYEAWDTKLSKSTRPYFLMQLCCYSWMLDEIQGVRPNEAVVVLGNGSKDRRRLVAEFSFFENLKSRFLKAQSEFDGQETSRPDPALYSEYGSWSSFAKNLMATTDSLAVVANIRKSQIKKLYDAGIKTLSQLAQTNVDSVKGISQDTYLKLKAQADIQLRSRDSATPLHEVVASDNGKGLSVLPEKSDLDVYFDIEGHPLVDGGLEYLWGVSYLDDNEHSPSGKNYAFKDWWAHTPKHEKLAFEGFIDWVYERWQRDPAMHVYHYASYEITAVSKISSRENTRQQQLAELLTNGVFVDLYKIVRNGLLIGEPRYSIKNVEHLYRGKRETEVANGGESVVFYENWREQGGVEEWINQPHGHRLWSESPEQFDWTKWKTLNEIRDYNIDDCESTLELVEWLRVEKQKNAIATITEVVAPEIQKTERQLANQQKREALQIRKQDLVDKFDADETLQNDAVAELLISLVYFFDRENKPKNWAYYARLDKTNEELFDDDTVLFGLKLQETSFEDGTLLCTAHFDKDQSYRKDKFESATLNGSEVTAKNINFTELDSHTTEVKFEVRADGEAALQQNPLSLLGEEPYINTSALENRLCDIAEDYFRTRQLQGVLSSILLQAKPKLEESSAGLPVTRNRYPDDTSYMQALIELAGDMRETCLCIQGPPGAGKTYTAKHVISSLVKNGKRIGIMSNSHAAIMNLLEPLPALLPEAALVKVGGRYKNLDAFRIDYPEEKYPNLTYRASMSFTKKEPYSSFSVTGATVYGFAKDLVHEEPLDFMFVDEASQVALANLVAVSGAAKNFILMGDQMQLEQPIQGSHPGKSGLSALEFLLQGHDVIPENFGVFLEQTYRMHPDVCRPLSEVVYEGRLTSAPKTENQSIQVPGSTLISKSAGILPVLVSHQGNTQSSVEEAQAINEIIDELCRGTYTNKDGNVSPVTHDDILVVAPYNMQVNLLIDTLPTGIKIGTIDKFQGQEAPVVIISMAISDVEESSRGLDFVFDINRLNVAISRAKALAIVVANENIHQCTVTSLEQMKKAGFYTSLIHGMAASDN